MRQVTILRFNTYSLGVYLDKSRIQKASIQKYTREVAESLVDQSEEAIVRLVPARNTNGTHLRNAFTRLLEDVTKSAPEVTPDDKEAINGFVASFPQVLPQGSELLICCSQKNGNVTVLFQGIELFRTNSKWLSRGLPLLYLDPDRNLIPGLIKQVSDNILS